MIAELAEIPFSEPLLEAAGKFIKKKYKTTEFLHSIRTLEEEHKRNVFENLSRQEEFDWTGLIEYIDENLLGRIASAFLSPDRDVREAVRKQAYIRAYCSARADTVASQRQVDRLMEKILIQTRDFLWRQRNPSDWLPFNQVTDEICVQLDTWELEIKEMIENQTQTFAEQHKKLLASLEYQNSFARVVDQLRLPQPIDSLFNYRDPKIGFYGREKEIAFLDNFLDRGEPVLFTAVNGPAGAGKSKFLYEYVKGLSANPNWKCLFLQNRKVLEKFTGLCEWKYPVNLLVVIDYAGDYASLIGEWLVSLKTGECPPKMRIVLLEREGVGKK
ncbi:MAG: ATP-binding protein [Eubacterium sp.]|nr:ATP-binding protein [Eubacterium sp.]